MALKQIPFSLEMVKKIQAGEIKGTIKTRDGRAARFLGEIKDNMYPLVFTRETGVSEKELLDVYTITGKYSNTYDSSELNIILEIETNEEEKQECQFKPFDKVLVRDKDTEEWKCALFSHNIKGECGFVASALYWVQCIPYEGNEHLLGTTNKPKED